MRVLLTLIFLFTVKNALADQPRLRFSFKSVNGYFELRPSDTIFSDNKVYRDSIYNPKTKDYFISTYSYPDRYYWGLYDLRTNEKLYTIKNDSLFIETKTARISDNGENVVIVDDYSGAFGIPNFEVVYFYKKEKLLKTLTLGNLLDNMCSVSYSVSHMTWCFDFNFLTDNSFKIKTYEYFNYRFDLNGVLIDKTSDSRILPNDDIVSCKIKRLEKNKYSFQINKSIRNKYEPNTVLILNVTDRLMRKIHGKFYGFLPLRNKKMETEFYKTLVLRDNRPIYSEFRFPIYNGDNSCNIINNKNGR